MLSKTRIRERVANTLQFIILFFLSPIFLFILFPFSRLRRVINKTFKKTPSIIWGPVPIINIYHNSRAVRKIGFKSDCITYRPYHITQSDLFDYNLEKWYRILPIKLILPFLVMIWAAFKYDIFHFFYNGGFLFLNKNMVSVEFLLWKLLGKITIISAYGSDVRLESITRELGKYNAYMDMTHEEVVNEVHMEEYEIKKRLDTVMKLSTVNISMGDMIEYTPGSKNDVFYWSIDVDNWQPIYDTGNEKVLILHAPNHTHYKGTRFLLPVIERLKNEGYPIEFVMVQNMTNAEARKYYEKADIIAEQFIIGWHGFFAVEAMALGKPVLCYIRKQEYLPEWSKCPIVNTNPENLYENLKKLILDKDLRQKIGRKGREYVEKVYSLESVGSRLDKIYKSIY